MDLGLAAASIGDGDIACIDPGKYDKVTGGCKITRIHGTDDGLTREERILNILGRHFELLRDEQPFRPEEAGQQ